MGPIPHIDAALRRAVETTEVPGVVAMAASDKGGIYEGGSARAIWLTVPT